MLEQLFFNAVLGETHPHRAVVKFFINVKNFSTAVFDVE